MSVFLRVNIGFFQLFHEHSLCKITNLFIVKAQNSSEVSLLDYESDLLLIVNIAIRCGFTPKQLPFEDYFVQFVSLLI